VFQYKVLTEWGPRALAALGAPLHAARLSASTSYLGLTDLELLFLALSAGSALKQVSLGRNVLCGRER
jgi:hypothetical protein